MDKQYLLSKIRSNIESTGHHVTIVSGGQEPRYAYTIGLTERLGFELILAGSLYYLGDEVNLILNQLAKDINGRFDLEDRIFPVDQLGSFSLRKVDSSWSDLMMLGVLDYYEDNHTNAYQVIPDENHYTLDIPDMSTVWKEDIKSSWKWLKHSKWEFNIPNNISVTTNLNVLKGEQITEIMRWEKDEWEMFAGSGSEVSEEEVRIVPMGFLLNLDDTLIASLDLKIGKGLWREVDGEWNDWG